jgi:hypothetical protein
MWRLKAVGAEQVVWRARLVLACLFVIALCLHRAPGKVLSSAVPGLLADPGSFLARALHLWDPHVGFGQVQSQAYGYLLPMGPFYWLMDAVSVPGWITQRLWWSLAGCVALLGIWKLAGLLRYGVAWMRFAVAVGYAAIALLLGAYAWPLALAPWVLVPLVTPRARPGWWRVGWSAIAFALVGGAHPIAAGVTLVPPVIWLLTRRLDRTTLKIAAGWVGCVVAVSIWWVVPLLLVNYYEPGLSPELKRPTAVADGRLVPQSRLVEIRGTADDVPTALTAVGGDWVAVTSSDLVNFSGLPLIQTEAAMSGERQPSVVVFRNGQDGSGSLRSIELPQAASYQLHGTAVPQDGAKTAVGCGNGPAVRVDGVPVETQVEATVQELTQRQSVAFSACEPAVALPAGRHTVDALAGGGFVPTVTTLTKAGFGNVSVTPAQDVDVWRPNAAALTVEVPAAAEQSVLTIAQNYTKGWEAYDGTGHKLTPIRIAGWQQGWILPTGPEQVVTARFMPDRLYRAGLLVGLLGLLTVLGLAVLSSNKTLRRARPTARALRRTVRRTGQ